MRDRVSIALFVSLLALLGVLVVLQHNALARGQDVLYVQSICDKAHSEISGSSETACGNAQNETNTEYLCTTATNDGYCWVEAK